MPCLQHGLMISNGRLLLLRLAKFQSRFEAPALEDRQRNGWSKHILQRRPLPKLSQIKGVELDVAAELHAWIEVSNGDANRCRRGVQLRFGLADVGAAAGEFGRNAKRHARRGRRDRLCLREFFPQRTWRFIKKKAQG